MSLGLKQVIKIKTDAFTYERIQEIVELNVDDKYYLLFYKNGLRSIERTTIVVVSCVSPPTGSSVNEIYTRFSRMTNSFVNNIIHKDCKNYDDGTVSRKFARRCGQVLTVFASTEEEVV